MTSTHDRPPDHLDEPLELDPADWSRRERYFLMTGLVVPRPIAWVSTRSVDGVDNVAPHSYFNAVSSDPVHIMFVSTGVKDTLTHVRDTGEFVVNLVSMDLVEEMNATATDLPTDVGEFDWVGLERAPSRSVAPPRVARAKAHLECRLANEVPVGDAFLVVGEVVHVHVDPSIWAAGRVDPERYEPVARLAGRQYAPLGEVFGLPRPRWDDVRDLPAAERIPRRG